MIREIIPKESNSRIALEMRLSIIEKANASGKSIVVSIDHLNRTIFKYVSDRLPYQTIGHYTVPGQTKKRVVVEFVVPWLRTTNLQLVVENRIL